MWVLEGVLFGDNFSANSTLIDVTVHSVRNSSYTYSTLGGSLFAPCGRQGSTQGENKITRRTGVETVTITRNNLDGHVFGDF